MLCEMRPQLSAAQQRTTALEVLFISTRMGTKTLPFDQGLHGILPETLNQPYPKPYSPDGVDGTWAPRIQLKHPWHDSKPKP